MGWGRTGGGEMKRLEQTDGDGGVVWGDLSCGPDRGRGVG